MGLRFKEQKGPRLAPHPWSQRAGDLTWEPSRLPGLMWAGQTPSSLLLLWSGVLEGSSHLPLLFSPRPPSYAPKDPRDLEADLEGRGLARELSKLPRLSGRGNHPPLFSCSSHRTPPTCLSCSPLGLPPMLPGPTQPGGGFGGVGTGLGAQQAPQPEWARRLPSAPLLLFLESPSHLPLLISLASGAWILSDLHFSSPFGPPTSYQFTLGFLLSPWGSEFSTSG